MASNINTNVDATFPVAGVDNNTQGFRDNFSVIKQSLVAAKTEIDDLLTRSVFKGPASGETTVNNDFNKYDLIEANLVGITDSCEDHGTALSNSTLSFGNLYHIYRVNTDTVITLEDFPRGRFGVTTNLIVSKVRIELRQKAANDNVTVNFKIEGQDADATKKIFYDKTDINDGKWSADRKITIDNTHPIRFVEIWTADGNEFFAKIIGTSFQE